MHDRIVIDPTIMFGMPASKGTRITVELLLRKMNAALLANEEMIVATGIKL